LAEFVYGICFEDCQDLLCAAGHYRRSADGGCCYGSEAFGECLEFGLGVSVDSAAACEYYRRAAESGFFLGEVNYGLCLEFGKGTNVDRQNAREFDQRASDKSARASVQLYSSEVAETSADAPNSGGAANGWSASWLEPRQCAGPILAGPSPMAPEADAVWPLRQTPAAWAGSVPFGGQIEALDLAGPRTPTRTAELPPNTQSVRDDGYGFFWEWNHARHLAVSAPTSTQSAPPSEPPRPAGVDKE
jgi:hypothetical protein